MFSKGFFWLGQVFRFDRVFVHPAVSHIIMAVRGYRLQVICAIGHLKQIQILRQIMHFVGNLPWKIQRIE